MCSEPYSAAGEAAATRNVKISVCRNRPSAAIAFKSACENLMKSIGYASAASKYIDLAAGRKRWLVFQYAYGAATVKTSGWLLSMQLEKTAERIWPGEIKYHRRRKGVRPASSSHAESLAWLPAAWLHAEARLVATGAYALK